MKTYKILSFSVIFVFVALFLFVFFSVQNSNSGISVPPTGFVPYPPTPSDIDITNLDPETVLCGNNICQSGENCSNCPSDCGSCVNQPASNTNQPRQNTSTSGSSGGSGGTENTVQPPNKISKLDLLLVDLKNGKDKNISLSLENGSSSLDALIELKISYKNKVVHSDNIKLKGIQPNETANASFKKLWSPSSEGEYIALVTVYSTDKKIKYYSLEKKIDFNVSGTQATMDSNKQSAKKPAKPVVVSNDKNVQTPSGGVNQWQGVIDLIYAIVIIGIIILLLVAIWKFFPNLFKP